MKLKQWLTRFNQRAAWYSYNLAKRCALLLDNNSIWVKRPAYTEKNLGLRKVGNQKVRCWQVTDSHGEKFVRVDDTFSFLSYGAPTFGVS